MPVVCIERGFGKLEKEREWVMCVYIERDTEWSGKEKGMELCTLVSYHLMLCYFLHGNFFLLFIKLMDLECSKILKEIFFNKINLGYI